MRGLTPAERATLLASRYESGDPETIDTLAARGLLVEVARDHTGEWYDTSAAGALALRLDAAARAMGGGA